MERRAALRRRSTNIKESPVPFFVLLPSFRREELQQIMQETQDEEVPRVAGDIALNVRDIISGQAHALKVQEEEPIQPSMIFPSKGV